LKASKDLNLRMLVIAPHPDDEVLGAGGVMSSFSSNGGDLYVLTVAAHMPPLYSEEVHLKTLGEAKKAHEILGVKESFFLNIPALSIKDQDQAEFNKKILEIIKKIKPQILLIPYLDRHIDHKLIFEAAMVASRPVGIGKNIKILAAYETLSETHWNAPHIETNFTPNWVVDISKYITQKMKAMSAYESQLHKFPEPRSLEALKALALFRGSQSGFGYGEGFHIVRMTQDPSSFIP